MRLTISAIVIALALAVPSVASAQVTTSTTQVTTTTMVDQDNHWIASGFVGTSFGAQAEDPAFDVGGSVGYLWRNAVGAEFVAGSAPNFELTSPLIADVPMVNTYMLNAIGAVPLGPEGQWQPYVSGGFGGIQLRSNDVINTGPAGGTIDGNNTKLGGNIGAGLMGYSGNVGIRADVRYFRATEDNNIDETGADAVASTLLSGLDFWRGSVGLAFRW